MSKNYFQSNSDLKALSLFSIDHLSKSLSVLYFVVCARFLVRGFQCVFGLQLNAFRVRTEGPCGLIIDDRRWRSRKFTVPVCMLLPLQRSLLNILYFLPMQTTPCDSVSSIVLPCLALLFFFQTNVCCDRWAYYCERGMGRGRQAAGVKGSVGDLDLLFTCKACCAIFYCMTSAL